MFPPSRPCITALLLLLPLSAQATNGMNMDSWGAKSGGMGGAAFAYDAGNSAVMNNPATLGLRQHERAEVGLGLTVLLPAVASSHPQAGARDSAGDAYYMPTLSWIRRQGDWTYGAAMLAQGGMGTEYGRGSSLFAGGMSMLGTPAPMSGQEIRSEVGVGRIMFPLAYRASDALTLAAQLDFVWATMDLKMDIDGATFGKLAAATPGVGRASGSLMALPAGVTNVHYARFDFSDDNAFSGEAKGNGWAGKLGIHYKLSDTFAVGATWHSKTHISDLETKHASMQMGVVGIPSPVTMAGKLKVLDFQWPETYGFGFAWQSTSRLMLVGDVKRIRWSDSMKNFSLKFEADGGGEMTAVMEQNWKDHTVYMLGGQYMYSPDIALRAGINVASNPVPSSTLNPLFPAIIENHLTLGLGWRIDPAAHLAVSLAYAPRVEDTNPNTGITSSHRQSTLRVNYNFTY
jgi:long-chain fatty acid transport protein